MTHAQDGKVDVSLFEGGIYFMKEMATRHNKTKFEMYRPPIKLWLLKIDYAGKELSSNDHAAPNVLESWKESFTGLLSSVLSTGAQEDDKSTGLWIEFTLLGRDSYKLVLQTLCAPMLSEWVDTIQREQHDMRQRSDIFQTTTICTGPFLDGSERINCAVPFGGGGQILIGTDKGLYLSNSNKEPVKVLGLHLIEQVDVVESHDLIVIRADKEILMYPFDALNREDPSKGIVQANRVTSNSSFFKLGSHNGRVIVTVVESTFISSTVKMYEVSQKQSDVVGDTSNHGVERVNAPMRNFRHFYRPTLVTSIHYLKTHICVATGSRGFQAVCIETLDIEPIFDPQDSDLDFVQKKQGSLKPVSIFSIEDDFLLCYDGRVKYMLQVA
ncbi:hypothetical protein D9619_006367 [Psilocybe cf. subviscida]|uniref:CNH domain-containing protein n=1 Tax=Psilocybe cf. subviscida TaxID=2480587 RepID=A0A8H5EXX5_9AGAR|nr:hypothetical protein D9619_006367 [Psilocybe cf. subviscida]